jgi:DNA replication protein DnaC
MIQATIEKLVDMKLFAMAEKAEQMDKSPNASALGSMELLSFCVDAEYDKRRAARLTRLKRDAHIKHASACVEEIDFKHNRNLSKDAMADILSGTALEHKSNILITGPTGVGKSFIACAVANLACQKTLRRNTSGCPVFWSIWPLKKRWAITLKQ